MSRLRRLSESQADAPAAREAQTIVKAVTPDMQEARRQQLIAATVRIIARHGLSNTTLAKVAQDAGLSPGIVNFYFTTKDQLLVAVLKSLSDEFMGKLEQALAESGVDPGENLQALIDAILDPTLSQPEKCAVWYAFWGEARAREEYMRLCGERDEAYHRAMLALCRQLAESAPDGAQPDPEAITWALLGLLDQLWQDIMAKPDSFDRPEARRLAENFLASVFPWRFTRMARRG
jgi:TetR/AcrR family transcriptional regulator, transcriptional repressor of bet genes